MVEYRIPVFMLGEGKTPLPPLSLDQGKALVRIILMHEAKRPSPNQRGGHPKEPLQGLFVCYQGMCSWRRGSDRVERIYASVEILKHAGLTEREACCEIGELLEPSLRRSNRGRRPKGLARPDVITLAEDVRGLYNDFKKRHPWKEKLPKRDPIVEKWFAHAVGIAAWSKAMLDPCDTLKGWPLFEEHRSMARNIVSIVGSELMSLYRRLSALGLRMRRIPYSDERFTFPNWEAVLPASWRPGGLMIGGPQRIGQGHSREVVRVAR